MPFKRKFRKKKRTDAKQNSRIKKLESLVLKTIENKQVNYHLVNQSISSGGYSAGSFCSTASGTEDGANLGDPARIGNTITLMNQRFNMNFVASGTDTYNQMRVLLVESLDGNEPLAMSDILQYHSYSLYGNLIFASPYTTKTNTNRRYKVHLDKSFVLSAFATRGGREAVVIKHNIKYKGGKLVEYPQGGATASNPTNHRITLLVVSSSVSADHPALSYSSRSTYKDA